MSPLLKPVASPSAGSLGSDTEEGRAFQRERLRLFAGITLAMSLGFFVLSHALRAALAGVGALRGPSAVSDAWHLATIAVLGLMWYPCRSRLLSRTALDWLDTGGMLLIATGYGLMGYTGRLTGPTEFAAVWATTVTLFARSVSVPSTARRTAALGLAAMVPPMIATWAILRQADPPLAPLVFQMRVAYMALWCVLGAAVSAVASRIIFGLREEVRAAQKLGQYTLLEKLGEGGMGEVYRARHALLRRPTAIKLLPPEKAGETQLARFEREVQITSELTHPNTIAIYDFGRTQEGVFYYAMEYLDGLDLDQLVERFGPQPPARVIHLLAQAAGALGEAHGRGLIHRDIKPANLVLCSRAGAGDVLKVLDFGLVKQLDSGDPGISSADTITGTPLYLAPEAIASPERMDARSDLYSLGAVAYRLLTGQHVFPGGSVIEVCGHHLHSEPVAPSRRLGRVLPADLEELVLQCLRKKPEERPAGAALFRSALLACADAGQWSEADAEGWWRAHGEEVRARRARPAPDAPLTLTIERALTREGPRARS